jgi:ribonuclease E
MRLRDLGGLIVIDFIDMEESRNRREVENRLRDALRQDRARVQFGSISKFGLMEMSRQRLKPALSEGSSIPCPRCGGSGHVRDTESSALQILRIIQEESMKDNTAAVHAQVPVEVASFLLNEKRPEIAKIELKQRINVLLVPNKSLETPHYKLERLKHDDPRLDHIEASYTMAEEVEDPTTVTRRSQEPTNRQTPVIKGVLPDAPAPASVPKPEPVKPQAAKAGAATESSGGFFGWLKRLFGGATETQAEPAKNVGKRGDRPSKDGERSERGDRNGERRGGRGGRGGRRGERNERGERSDADRNDKNERSENTETRAPRENAGNRRGGERNERSGQRGERRDNANNSQSADASNLTADATENNADNRNEGRNERAPRGEGRRERGEGRRERGERRSPDGNRQNASSDNADNMSASLNDSANVQANTSSDASSSVDERADGTQATPERRERRSRDRYGRDRRERNANAEGTTEANTTTSETTSDAQRTQEEAPIARSYFDRAASMSPVNSASAPAENVPASAPTTVAAAAPTTTAAPAASGATSAAAPASSNAAKSLPKVQAYELPMASLIAVAEGSGLQWVNSDPAKIAQVQAAIAAEPKPVHVPRERPPAVVLDEGPLVLVETRKDLSNMNLPF